jgi:nicotinate-nucleotide adenylyltransferase
MKIGLYFGTFNPIHVGYLIPATAENSDLEQMVSRYPHNPHKKNFARRLSSIANGTSSD